MFERLINYRARRNGINWHETKWCGHGQPAIYCLERGDCAKGMDEVDMLEEWWELEADSSADKLSGVLLWPLIVVWSIFGVFVVARAVEKMRVGHYQEGVCCLALFALMAAGAWFVPRKGADHAAR